MVNQNDIIAKTVEYVRSELANAEGGHDWWHIHRVRVNALKIAQEEDCNPFIVELAALLHDIADSKFHSGNEDIGPTKARDFLEANDLPEDVIQHIVQIIRNVSFKGGHVTQSFESIELAVVQDADRLDAIGAIGVARAFNYGGHKGRLLYHPDIKPVLNMDKETYKRSTAPTINHFYEKLLLLKDRMNTETGRRLAEERHRFMEHFLEQFYTEWNGI
ncbi:MAG: HD domain-containing protein [Saprospiraceae bacterium]|nr:HD domain-containing protein [Saprospiraceae bacterium]